MNKKRLFYADEKMIVLVLVVIATPIMCKHQLNSIAVAQHLHNLITVFVRNLHWVEDSIFGQPRFSGSKTKDSWPSYSYIIYYTVQDI
jgi:hypothetical protein